MRLFTVLAVALVTGGGYLTVTAALQVAACLDGGFFNLALWRSDFWLRVPSEPWRGIGHNAAWFVRLLAAAPLIAIGRWVLHLTRR